MPRVERTYTEDGIESSQWRQAIIRLLSTGLFQYLKKEGLLRQDKQHQGKISKLLQETSKLTLDGSVENGNRLDSSPSSSVNGAESKGEAPT